MKDRHPFGILTAVESLYKVRISGGDTRWKRTTTGRLVSMVSVASQTRTYRFFVVKHGDVDPYEVQYGGIPILKHSQARYDSKDFGVPYSNEQREYCAANV